MADLFAQIALDSAFSDLVDAVSSQMAALLPIGVALIGIFAVPRIIKRVIHTFL